MSIHPSTWLLYGTAARDQDEQVAMFFYDLQSLGEFAEHLPGYYRVMRVSNISYDDLRMSEDHAFGDLFSTCDGCDRAFLHDDPGPDHCPDHGGCLSHCGCNEVDSPITAAILARLNSALAWETCEGGE
jgi:hypothetical protein